MPRRIQMELGRGHFILDSLSIFLALMACLVGMIIYVFNANTFTGSIGLFIAISTMIGLVFGVMILKSPIDRILDRKEMTHIVRWSMLGFVMIIILQSIIFRMSGLSSVGWYNKIFYMSIAIGEAFFFRFAILQFLYQWFKNMPGSLFISSLMTSIVFTVYHGAVYGTIPVALMAVFASSMVLCVITICSNRISVPILSHMWVNLFAS